MNVLSHVRNDKKTEKDMEIKKLNLKRNKSRGTMTCKTKTNTERISKN